MHLIQNLQTMKKFLLFQFLLAFGMQTVFAQKIILPQPGNSPSKAQQKQIDRKYGMFIHFGINTFHDEEWTDGDGFCLWDSKYTDYDVASSPNPTNVVEAVAKACKKYDIGLGLYYSLWDRKVNADTQNQQADAAYNEFMLKQIEELFKVTKKYTHVVEFWFDGGWTKQNYRWPIMQLYQTIKNREPECQVGINWSIGSPENADQHPVLPEQQKEGFPIRYFPSDFRLGDPYLPTDQDPKIFTYSGQNYYMPWESTICISQRWFYNTKDQTYKTVDELEKLYRQCTKNNNILR